MAPQRKLEVYCYWVYFEEFYWAWSYEEQGRIGIFFFKLQL